MLKLCKVKKSGMLHSNVKPIDTKLFQAKYPTQYQLDILRMAILNKPNAIEELREMEEARYGNTKK